MDGGEDSARVRQAQVVYGRELEAHLAYDRALQARVNAHARLLLLHQAIATADLRAATVQQHPDHQAALADEARAWEEYRRASAERDVYDSELREAELSLHLRAATEAAIITERDIQLRRLQQQATWVAGQVAEISRQMEVLTQKADG